MPYKFQVQEKKRLRIIIDTDAACEADDQYAIVHALLTPRFDVKGIIAEQFYSEGGETSAEKSYKEVEKILSLMEIDTVPVYKGYAYPLKNETDTPDSDGADFIISQALENDSRPLFVLCQGAITNVAIALNKCPEIADKFTCIWIGGGFYEKGGWEFNLTNDYNAANVVFKSKCNLCQVPMDCYSTMQVGYAELQMKVRPCGKIGRYLFDELVEVGMNRDWVQGESWSLGDSPALAIALNPGCAHYEERPAPLADKYGGYVGEVKDHIIKVYHQIDSRYVLEDFFAKLAINYQ